MKGEIVTVNDVSQLLSVWRKKGWIYPDCEPGRLTCRPRQRQALLHWVNDNRKI